jgi:hypothetical protein
MQSIHRHAELRPWRAANIELKFVAIPSRQRALDPIDK